MTIREYFLNFGWYYGAIDIFNADDTCLFTNDEINAMCIPSKLLDRKIINITGEDNDKYLAPDENPYRVITI